MRKTEAIELLGGSIPAVAEAVGVTYQAVDKWPDMLPPRIADRVQAALWRLSQGASRRSTDTQPAQAAGGEG
jgi:hypothetical protein